MPLLVDLHAMRDEHHALAYPTGRVNALKDCNITLVYYANLHALRGQAQNSPNCPGLHRDVHQNVQQFVRQPLSNLFLEVSYSKESKRSLNSSSVRSLTCTASPPFLRIM